MCVSLPGPPVGGPFQLVLPLTHESPPALHHHPPTAELPQLLVAAAPVRTAEPAPAPSVPPTPATRGRASRRAPFIRASAIREAPARSPLSRPRLRPRRRPGRPTPGALSFPAWDARRWHSATVHGHGPQRHRSQSHSVGKSPSRRLANVSCWKNLFRSLCTPCCILITARSSMFVCLQKPTLLGLQVSWD
ncbi:hypothetical protein PVAP13_9NG330919 [Panicum virgatum]|uniref:Uncharacterized protein n=1 Tax=Panicum virgatum TaxID=38727 RepID=A0A8T0MMQ0_PANVG|nr:hypothetical protein PVAP13_9NG330919 [Panicum virgatum]